MKRTLKGRSAGRRDRKEATKKILGCLSDIENQVARLKGIAERLGRDPFPSAGGTQLLHRQLETYSALLDTLLEQVDVSCQVAFFKETGAPSSGSYATVQEMRAATVRPIPAASVPRKCGNNRQKLKAQAALDRGDN